VLADEDYITQCRAQGLYPMGYYPHNIHFLWSAAAMEGRSAAAVEAARKVASKVSPEMMAELPFLAGFAVVPYHALTRFGRWDEMLAEPPPEDRFLYLKGTWKSARQAWRMALACADVGCCAGAGSASNSKTITAPSGSQRALYGSWLKVSPPCRPGRPVLKRIPGQRVQ
jgi:hypothetical protein